MLNYLKNLFSVSEWDTKIEYVIYEIRRLYRSIDDLDYMVKSRHSVNKIDEFVEEISQDIASIRTRLIDLRQLDRKSPYTTETQNRRKHLTTLTNQFIELESKYCNMTRK